MKTCSKCKVEKELSEFNKHKFKKSGYTSQCKGCIKQYYQQNKEKIAEQQKQHYQQNKEKILEKQKQYYQQNKENISEQKKQHYQQNKEKILEIYEQNKKDMAEWYKQFKNEEKTTNRKWSQFPTE